MDNINVLQMVVTAFSVLISSGLVQFLISRKDKKEEDAKKNEFEILRKEFKEGIGEREKASQERYEILHKEITDGLDEREKTGKNRYDEHHISIEKMSLQHQKDFQTLLEAINQLKDNDTSITNSIKTITETQLNIGNTIIGLAHDKLVYSTDKIIERGAVTIKEKATLNSIYQPYLELGGNSYAKQGMEHVAKLPVVSDDEARDMDIKLKQAHLSM